MKVIHLSLADIHGGAFTAAYRIHHALRGSDVDSYMWVDQAKSGDWSVIGPQNTWQKIRGSLAGPFGNLLRHTLRTSNQNPHSSAVLPSRWVERINASDADIVQLHWIQGEMLSIADIGRIKKPIVWTLHDMWAFCGAEHYTEEMRWREGYHARNRPAYESRFDLNRWVWRRKRKHWRQPMHIVAPSHWLANCARESALMRNWSVERISYPIDIHRWSPIDKSVARNLLGLPQNVPLLLFGAMGGERDPRKGFDLLASALGHLRGEIDGLELAIFGQLAPREPSALGFPVHYMGHLYDDLSLRVLYSASDAFALPSRQDNQPLTCMEALSCGVPVIAFDSSGPPSMLEHKRTGYLAKAFDPVDFAQGVEWTLANSASQSLRTSARKYAEQWFAPERIAEEYLSVYKTVLSL